MWSMPRSVLRIVAVIIALCAVGGFVLGFRGAPEKARLPGEGPPGSQGAAQLQATDVKPLTDEAPVPPPPVVAAIEDKKPEKKPEVDPSDLAADQLPAKPAIKPAALKPVAPPPPAAEDRVGDLLDGITPPDDDPPH